MFSILRRIIHLSKDHSTKTLSTSSPPLLRPPITNGIQFFTPLLLFEWLDLSPLISCSSVANLPTTTTATSLHTLNQSDQIGQFLKVLGDKISSKSSRNDRQLFGKFWKTSVLSKTTGATFWATFGYTWAFFYSNFWSHCESQHSKTQKLWLQDLASCPTGKSPLWRDLRGVKHFYFFNGLFQEPMS